jgi:hypothetical protein
VIRLCVWAAGPSLTDYIWVLNSNFGGFNGGGGGGAGGTNGEPPQNPTEPGPCELMAQFAQDEVNFVLSDMGGDTTNALPEFDKRFAAFYPGRDSKGQGRPMRTFQDVVHYGKGGGTRNRLASNERLGQSDFATQFYENSPRGDAEDQTHHFAAYFSLGINGRPFSEWSAETLDRSGGEPDRLLGPTLM